MTISTIATSLLAATLAFATPAAAFAAPQAGLRHETAAGCGIGRSRDAMGHCRHRFNLFDHQDRRHFHAYRQNHCTMVETPNGRVRRCRI